MEFEELKQGDPRWSKIKLGHGTGTIGDYGCTITSLAMFAGIRPDVLNTMLKGTSFEDSAFAGASRNLINWLKLEKYTKGLIKFYWRGGGYNEAEIKKSISEHSACLIEVDFDGTGPKGDKHWILAKGNKLANDPYTGNEIPTNKYPLWTGWAEISVNRTAVTTDPLKECLKQHLELVEKLNAQDELIKVLNETIKQLEKEKKELADKLEKCQNLNPQTIEETIEVAGKNWKLNGIQLDSNGLLNGNYELKD